MSVHRNRTPRMAALLSVVALGASVLTTAPALAASTHGIASHAVAPSVAVKAATKPDSVVSRLSLSSGPVAGGGKILIVGTKLATGTSSFTAKTVKFGDAEVASSKVTALSADVLQVEVPPGSADKLVVTVLVGDAVKGPKYTYIGTTPTVTTDQDDLDDLTPSSESGLADATVAGTNFNSATGIYVGGKKLKATVTATEIKFAFPAGLSGVQDVVVLDSRKSFYVGYVTYSALVPTITATSVDSVIAEAPTAVTLTGTNLTSVKSVTFNDEKASLTATKDATKLTVTIPKGAAVDDGVLKITTAYGKTATTTLDRKASLTPTVTAVAAATDAIAKGGVFTLTGTNLVGLKAVTIKSSATGAKDVKGSSITEVTATSAKVKLPKLANGTYTLTATTWASTAATYTVVVANGAITDNTPVTPPAPALTDVSYDAAVDGGAPATLTLEGTNLAVGDKVRYYTTDVADAVTVTVTGAASATAASATLAADLADGTYHVQVSTSAGTVWSTAVDLVVAA